MKTDDWEYQRDGAQRAVRGMTGVVGVSNNITLKPVVTPADIRGRIQDALKRHAEREASDIDVKVSDSIVTLRGQVDSLAERAAAQGAAWAAPGISRVVNDLTVGALA